MLTEPYNMRVVFVLNLKKQRYQVQTSKYGSTVCTMYEV